MKIVFLTVSQFDRFGVCWKFLTLEPCGPWIITSEVFLLERKELLLAFVIWRIRY